MKAKFSPRCQCGLGDRTEDKTFYKHRFILEGDGRVVLAPGPKEGTRRYRTELINYLAGIMPENTLYVHSEDYIDTSCTVFSLITPEKETNPLLNCFEIGYRVKDETEELAASEQPSSPMPHSTGSDSIYNLSFDTTAAKYGYTKSTATPTKKRQPRQSRFGVKDMPSANDTASLQYLDMVRGKVATWISTRMRSEDAINLPKTRQALEKSIAPFCRIAAKYPIDPILATLHLSGDIILCTICQTVKPTAPNSTTFYFTHGSVERQLLEHCHAMMNLINTTFEKMKQVAIPLLSIVHAPFKHKLEIEASIVVDSLINSYIIQVDSENVIQYQFISM
eukprot:gene15595-18527_t